MEVSLVPYGHIAATIPALLPYLQTSADWSDGRSNVDDIVRFLLKGDMLLWVVFDDADIHGYVITEVKQYPQCKMLVLQYCAGRTGVMEAAGDKLHELMYRFAKDAGCAGVEFVGRSGWRNFARKHGYGVQSVVYQKFFEVAP